MTTADFVVSASNSKLGVFNTSISGQRATEGSQFLDHQSAAGATTTFVFNFPIDSFGFDLIDYGDNGPSGQLQLTTNSGDNLVVASSPGSDGNVRYFGLISSGLFTRAVFTNTIGGEAFAFDRMNYGVHVCEPSAFIGLCTTLTIVLSRVRRR